jgi:hypothetical protein
VHEIFAAEWEPGPRDAQEVHGMTPEEDQRQDGEPAETPPGRKQPGRAASRRSASMAKIRPPTKDMSGDARRPTPQWTREACAAPQPYWERESRHDEVESDCAAESRRSRAPAV